MSDYPSIPTVQITGKTWRSITALVTVSSFGNPSSASGRLIELGLFDKNSYFGTNVNNLFSQAYGTSRVTMTVDPSISYYDDSKGGKSLNMMGNQHFWVGAGANNTVYSQGGIVGDVYLPCKPIAILRISRILFTASATCRVYVQWDRDTDGKAEKPTLYWRAYTANTSNSSSYPWNTVNLTSASQVSGSFDFLWSCGYNTTAAKLEVKLVTPNGGSSESKIINFDVPRHHSVPTFSNFEYLDTNSSVVSITGNNQIIIQGQSLPKVVVSKANQAVANDTNYGVSISRYDVTFSGRSASMNYTGEEVSTVLQPPMSYGSQTLRVSAVDSVEASMPVNKTVQVMQWSAPVVSVVVERKNNYETESTVKIKGTYSPLVVGGVEKNTVQVNYQYKRTNQSEWSSSIGAIATLNSNNGTFEVSSFVVDALDNNYSWDFKVTAIDKFAQGSAQVVVDVGHPLFFIGTDGRVGIGGIPEKYKQSGDYGHLEIFGSLYVNGKKIE